MMKHSASTQVEEDTPDTGTRGQYSPRRRVSPPPRPLRSNPNDSFLNQLFYGCLA